MTFWITDRRIINRSGIISYSIRSIPVDVITDVILHRGPWISCSGQTRS